MNLMNLTGNYGMTTIVVLSWLSLYFILVVWIFLYRYFTLNSMIQREKKNVECLLKGKNIVLRESTFNLNGIDRKKSESLLQYFLNKATAFFLSHLSHLSSLVRIFLNTLTIYS